MKRLIFFSLGCVFVTVWGLTRFPQGWNRSSGSLLEPLEALKDGRQIVEHFNLEGFEDLGKKSWQLEGKIAHVTENVDVFIEKNVTLKIAPNILIKTDKVFWQNQMSRFMTRRPVEINHGGRLIRGIGAGGKVQEGFFQIHRKIWMRLEGPILVRCRGPLKFYYKESRALLFRDVLIRDTKGTIRSDRLEVLFDESMGKVKKVIARGRVRIKRPEGTSESELAVYDTETQSIHLQGAPEILIQERHVEDFKNPGLRR